MPLGYWQSMQHFPPAMYSWHFMLNIHPCDPKLVKPSAKLSALANILGLSLFPGRMNPPNLLIFVFAYFCNSLYFFSIFLAPFTAIVLLNPQLSQAKPSISRFPSAPQFEQIIPVPLELISTNSIPLAWHFCAILFRT